MIQHLIDDEHAKIQLFAFWLDRASFLRDLVPLYNNHIFFVYLNFYFGSEKKLVH